ncbi:DUF1707 domain-containing protein [Kribbella sp. NBC_01505]|uniref:DUF1707 SHOCT-like domain-containing protein n=1 Tax=Kribbella sp. NBC_01505 TaxID=2903580 RepID=UPI00386CD7EA
MSTPQWQGPEWYDAVGRNRPLRSVRSGRDDRDDRGTRAQRRAVRIGDSERDRAVAQLGEHFVAGRLTQDEFEERSETATRARYVDELEPLFEDLPATGELQVARAGRHPQQFVRPSPMLLVLPFLMVGLVVTAVTLTAPWLLWGVFWVAIFSGMHRRRHHPRGPGGNFST